MNRLNKMNVHKYIFQRGGVIPKAQAHRYSGQPNVPRVCQRVARFMVVLAFGIFLAGCTETAQVRGQIEDISGHALPGVVVRVIERDQEALSNATGDYSLRTEPGDIQLEFFKTGYTPAHLQLHIDGSGAIEVATVRLWPLPIGEGVYLFKNYRYEQTDHPRINRYRAEEEGIVFGTPVAPGLLVEWADPEKHPELNPPMLIAHKLPAYDARLHRLQQMYVASAPAGVQGQTGQPARDIQYTEEAWVADDALPLIARPIDEPEKLLVEFRAATPLSPGMYALHWGALEGYDSIDPRVFLFAVVEKASDEEPSEEGEIEGEATAG